MRLSETLRELTKKQENEIKSYERLKNHLKTAKERAEKAEAARKKAEEETAVLTEVKQFVIDALILIITLSIGSG